MSSCQNQLFKKYSVIKRVNLLKKLNDKRLLNIQQKKEEYSYC